VDIQSHVELGETEPATVDMDMQSLEKVYLFLPPYSHLQEWENQFLQEHAQHTYSSKGNSIKENDRRTNNSFFLAKHLCVAASQSRGSTMGEQDNDSSLIRILQKKQ